MTAFLRHTHMLKRISPGFQSPASRHLPSREETFDTAHDLFCFFYELSSRGAGSRESHGLTRKKPFQKNPEEPRFPGLTQTCVSSPACPRLKEKCVSLCYKWSIVHKKNYWVTIQPNGNVEKKECIRKDDLRSRRVIMTTHCSSQLWEKDKEA